MKTPQLSFPKLSAALGIANEVWLKREDLHHYGSHKGRSIPTMINEYRKQGVTNFVISSSGNAALAAIMTVQKANQNNGKAPLHLRVLVGEKIDPKKLASLQPTTYNLQPTNIKIEQCERPKQTAFQMEKENKAKWLRQSTDDLALVGYQELALELSKIPNLAAVFIPTSSGTTAQGLHEGFQKLGLNPEIHIVQTDGCHPMVAEVESHKVHKVESPSLASAIVDRIAHRKSKILEILKTSHGKGWIATNDEIQKAIQLVKENTGIDISPNSALAVVGLQQAINSGRTWEGSVVCVVTGR